MRRRILVTLTFVLIGTYLSPLQAQTLSRAALVARIDSLVNASLAADKTPGITVGVVRGNDTIVLKGYGLADVENNLRVTPESVFRIGSITKQFTSSAIMKLVEEGKVKLDATLADYVPEYQGPGKRVTVHQLLNHTSGIKSYTSLGNAFWEKSRLDLTHAQLLDMFVRDSLVFEPGSRYQYNNSGYYLLGMIIEKVTGKTYAEHLQATQWGPLGLEQTMYCGQREIIPHRAQGYEVQNGQVANAAPMSMNLPFAAGAMCSTPRDLIRWTRALHSGRVVSPASFTKMTTPTQLSTGATTPYGYGLSRGRSANADVIQHSGGINGFSAYLAHYPADTVTIAVIANGPTNTGQLHGRIARAVFGIAEPVIVDLPTTPEQRARYVGNYDLSPTMQMQIRILEQNNRLFGQAAGQAAFPLRRSAEHTFDGPDGTGIRIVFTMNGDRAASFAFTQGGGSTTQAKRVQ